MEANQSFLSLFIISLLAFAIPIAATRVGVVRIPIVVGEILAGIVVGRSGFNLVVLDPALEFLAAFGFAYLMFLSGLEIDFDLLLGRGIRFRRETLREPLGLGVLTFILTLVASVSTAFGLYALEMVRNPWLMALILSTTSVGIVMPILKERHITGGEWGQSILIAALVADFATMLLITAVAAFLGEREAFEFTFVLLLFGAFFTLYRLGVRFMRLRPVVAMMNELAHTTAQIRIRGCYALVLAFVALSLQLGAELILGAFLAGAMVSLLAGRESHDLRMSSTPWATVSSFLSSLSRLACSSTCPPCWPRRAPCWSCLPFWWRPIWSSCCRRSCFACATRGGRASPAACSYPHALA